MSRKLIFAAAAAAAAATFAASPAGAQWGNWRTIAFKTVSGGTDVNRINVRGNQRFRQVRLCAYNAPIRLRDFDIASRIISGRTSAPARGSVPAPAPAPSISPATAGASSGSACGMSGFGAAPPGR